MAATNTESSHPFRWHYGDLEDKNFQVHGRSLLLVLIIFSVILICTLLCLYARWAWRYRQLAESSRQQFSVSSDALAVRHSQLGLDSVALGRLPVFLYKSPASIRPGSEDPQCAICLSVFREEQKVKVLPVCRHSFHPDCVDKWLSEQPSCPLCRSSLATILATARNSIPKVWQGAAFKLVAWSRSFQELSLPEKKKKTLASMEAFPSAHTFQGKEENKGPISSCSHLARLIGLDKIRGRATGVDYPSSPVWALRVVEGDHQSEGSQVNAVCIK